ncbi:MAG: hypothetical protein HZC54_11345 [Verrucomicrobia bacterium]|nr:hypothetical protein [Verrucomicrobiota bacterium]
MKLKNILFGACLFISFFAGSFALLMTVIRALDLVGLFWLGSPMVSPPIHFTRSPLAYAGYTLFWSIAAWLLLRTLPRCIVAGLDRSKVE